MTDKAKPDVKEMMLRHLSLAADDVLNGGEAMRYLFAVSGDGKVTMIAAPCEGDDNDSKLVNMLRISFVADDVQQYAMVFEGWTSEDPAHSRAAGSMPKNDPRRGEALVGLAVIREKTATGGTTERRMSVKLRITRNPTAVGDLEWEPEGSELTGRFFTLMPPLELGEIDPKVRAAAQVAVNLMKGKHVHDIDP